MNAHELDRRRVLQLLAALGVALGAPGLSVADSSATCGSALAEGLDMKAVREIGREYLAAHPEAAVLAGVIALLEAESSAQPSSIAKLRKMMHADYAAGRIINVSGWFLSATEAHIFAGLSRCTM
ncbi:MAG: hypothetical protein ACREV5_05090 [Steroidobacter sp.]